MRLMKSVLSLLKALFLAAINTVIVIFAIVVPVTLGAALAGWIAAMIVGLFSSMPVFLAQTIIIIAAIMGGIFMVCLVGLIFTVKSLLDD